MEIPDDTLKENNKKKWFVLQEVKVLESMQISNIQFRSLIANSTEGAIILTYNLCNFISLSGEIILHIVRD